MSSLLERLKDFLRRFISGIRFLEKSQLLKKDLKGHAAATSSSASLFHVRAPKDIGLQNAGTSACPSNRLPRIPSTNRPEKYLRFECHRKAEAAMKHLLGSVVPFRGGMEMEI